MRCQVIQSSARQCFGVWKVGDSSVGESWGGIYLEKCCRWCSVLRLGGFSPKMSLGQGFRCKWFIKEVLSEGIWEQDKEGAVAQRSSDLSSCTQPAWSGGELWNGNYTSEITTLNQRCQALVLSYHQSVIGYRLPRGKCKIPRVKQLWCPRSVLQKSSVQAVSSKVQSW